MTDRFPEVEGFFEHYGADVFHCPACDGYEARGRKVVVLGWNAHVAGFALSLLDWASSVTVVTDGHRFEGAARHRAALGRHDIEIVEEGATAFHGSRGALEGVLLASARGLRGGGPAAAHDRRGRLRSRRRDAGHSAEVERPVKGNLFGSLGTGLH